MRSWLKLVSAGRVVIGCTALLLLVAAIASRRLPPVKSTETSASEVISRRSRTTGAPPSGQDERAALDDQGQSRALAPSAAVVPARDGFGSAWETETRPTFAALKHWTEEYLSADPATRAALLEAGIKLAQERRLELKELIQTDPRHAIASAVPIIVRRELPSAVLDQLEEYVSGQGELALIGVTPLPGEPLIGKPYFRTARVNGKHYEAFVYGRRELQQTKVDISIVGIALDKFLAVSESPVRVLERGEIPDAGKPVSAICPISGRTTSIQAGAPMNVDEITSVNVAGEVKQLCSPVHVPLYEAKLIHAEDTAGPYPALVLGSETGGTSDIPGRPPISWTHGAKKVLIIRVDFSDIPGTPQNFLGQFVTEDYAVNLFNQFPGLRDFFEQSSYGQTTLTIAPTVNGDSPDVTPVYRMPSSAPYYATNRAHFFELESDAHAAATNGGYNLTNYDRIGLVVSYQFPLISGSIAGGGGFAAVQGKDFSTYGSFNWYTVAHELGHNWGLQHDNFWQATDGNPVSPDGSSLEYGDPYSMMGGADTDLRRHFSHRSKNLLQWIPDGAVPTVEWSGTYRVYRYDHQDANLSNNLALKIARDNVRDYWVGFRQAFADNPSLVNGAYVTWAANKSRKSELLALSPPYTNRFNAGLTVGSTFTDSVAGITIQTLGKGGSTPDEYLDVQIKLPARIQWSSTNYVFAEESGAATLTLLRTADSNGVVSVNFATMNGTAVAPDDYTATNGMVTWIDGDVSPKTITVPLVVDSAGEGLESFGVALDGISGGVIVNGAVVPVNIAASSSGFIQWSSNSYTFNEQSGAAMLTLLRSGNSNGVISVNYATSDDFATAPDDYLAATGTVAWAAGDLSPKTVSIPLIEDFLAESAEDFTVSLSEISGGIVANSPVVTVNIAAQVFPRIQWASVSYTFEEQSGSATLTLLRSANTNDVVSVYFVTLDGTASAPADYVSTNGTVTWDRGDVSPKFIAVPLVVDDAAEGVEYFALVMRGIFGGIIANGAAAPVNIAGQPALASFTLIKDINTQFNAAGSLLPSADREMVNVNGTLFFIATNSVYGLGLWKSDGTAEGTVLLKTGPAHSLVNVNGTLFFARDDFAAGTELWKSDGTVAGTVLVKDIHAGSDSSSPASPANVNGTLFFSANDGASGAQLWKSDGTPNGTIALKQVLAQSPVNVNGTLFFAGTLFGYGQELWKSDGTTNGTVMVKDIRPGGNVGSNPTNLVSANSALFFTANDGTNGVELWKSDGTSNGTVLVKNIRSGNLSSAPANLTDVNGTLFFAADDGTNGVELWKSDGTEPGTVLVKNIRAVNASSSPASLANVNGMLFFSANDGTNNVELWKSDGTENGTVMVRDIFPGSAGSTPAEFVDMNGTLFFTATGNTTGRELWRSDGSSNGTVIVKDIRAPAGSSSPTDLVNAGGTLFFRADNGTNGVELWKSDGTDPGTMMVKDVEAGTLASDAGSLTDVNNTLFFSANDGTNGVELWKSDGTPNGTVMVRDIYSGANNSSPANLLNVNGTLFFVASTSANGRELWRSDGTGNGTVIVKDIRAGSVSANPATLLKVNGTLYFTANDGTNGIELWRSDGTTNGTAMVKDIRTGATGSSPTNLAGANGTLFFAANDGTNGVELWKSDGTEPGTVMVKDIAAGANSSNPAELVNVNGLLFFSAVGALWKSDGTSNGTVMLLGGGSSPSQLVNVNGILFLVAATSANGRELWKSDGTSNGTAMVKDIFPGNGSSAPANLMNLNGKLLFTANDNVHGWELWMSDGTSEGTIIIGDIYLGSGSSNPSNLMIFNGRLFFLAHDGVHGQELWTSDGTEAGTIRFTDVPGTPFHSTPTGLTASGRTLFFTAGHPGVGSELSALFLNDYGDAGDPLVGVAGHYPTRLARNGARHRIPTAGPQLYLGVFPPLGDLDAQPDANATGDATEDGVTLPVSLNSGQIQTAIVRVTGSGGLLNAWADWNQDGDWDDAGEQISTNHVAFAGDNELTFTVPTLNAIGPSFARFRLSTASDLATIGAAPDGEVEDYQVTLVPSPTTLQIQSFGNGTFVITFNGVPNQPYRIEYADELAGANWQTLNTVVVNGQGLGAFTNNPSADTRFYRTVFP